MWALIPQVVAWFSTAAIGWFANDVSTPDVVSPEVAEARKRKQQIRLGLLVLLIISVAVFVYNKFKQSKNGAGSRKV